VLGQFHRQPRRRGAGRACGEDAFDDAVLKRVVSQDNGPPAHGQGVDHGRHDPFESDKLTVNLDPEGLERPFGRIPAGATCRRGDAGPDQVHQACAAGEGSFHPLPHHGFGDPPCEALFAVLAQESGQLTDRIGVEHLGRGDPTGRIHPHVKRSIHGVGEPPGRLVQLQGRDARSNTLDRGQPEPLDHLRQLVVHRMHQVDTISERGQATPREIKGLWVTIDTDKDSARTSGEQGFAVPAQAKRPVDDNRALDVECWRQ
jgi:hypothetical protein